MPSLDVRRRQGMAASPSSQWLFVRPLRGNLERRCCQGDGRSVLRTAVRANRDLAMRRLSALLSVAIAAFISPSSAIAQSVELPLRKPGYWEIHLVTEKPSGKPTIEQRMCVDAATDRQLMEFGLSLSKDACKRYDLKRAAVGWVIDTECAIGPIKTVSHTTISGDFQSNITVRIEGTTEGIRLGGAAPGPQQTLMVQTSRWAAAACPSGMVPGDVSMGNGLKVNIKQLKQLQKMLPQLQVR
jgi:hypothetical protein